VAWTYFDRGGRELPLLGRFATVSAAACGGAQQMSGRLRSVSRRRFHLAAFDRRGQHEGEDLIGLGVVFAYAPAFARARLAALRLVEASSLPRSEVARHESRAPPRHHPAPRGAGRDERADTSCSMSAGTSVAIESPVRSGTHSSTVTADVHPKTSRWLGPRDPSPERALQRQLHLPREPSADHVRVRAGSTSIHVGVPANVHARAERENRRPFHSYCREASHPWRL